MTETELDNATAHRSVDQQQACSPAFSMFYAERLGGEGEPYIAERGVFRSLEEFLPYRRRGWSGTKKTNVAADALIEAAGVAPHHATDGIPPLSAAFCSAGLKIKI